MPHGLGATGQIEVPRPWRASIRLRCRRGADAWGGPAAEATVRRSRSPCGTAGFGRHVRAADAGFNSGRSRHRGLRERARAKRTYQAFEHPAWHRVAARSGRWRRGGLGRRSRRRHPVEAPGSVRTSPACVLPESRSLMPRNKGCFDTSQPVALYPEPEPTSMILRISRCRDSAIGTADRP